MPRRDRGKSFRGNQLRGQLPAPTGPLPDPPAYLKTWRWRQPGRLETTEAWLERTQIQRAALLAGTETWLATGRRVKVHLDPRVGGGDVAGRIGTIFRLGSPALADFICVHFVATSRQKRPRVRLLPIEILTPTE